MTMIDRLGEMSLADIKKLRVNAERLSKVPGKQQVDAAALLAAIDEQLAGRDQAKTSAAARKAERAANPKPPKEPKAERAPREPKAPKRPLTESEKVDAFLAGVDEAIGRK